VAALEWAAKALHWPRLPGSYAILTTGATAFCTVQFIRTKKRVKHLKKGRDSERIHIDTRGPDAAPIIQCKAEVGDIKSLLKESTSKSFPVRGVDSARTRYFERGRYRHVDATLEAVREETRRLKRRAI
jgi:hypothetical protein